MLNFKPYIKKRIWASAFKDDPSYSVKYLVMFGKMGFESPKLSTAIKCLNEYYEKKCKENRQRKENGFTFLRMKNYPCQETVIENTEEQKKIKKMKLGKIKLVR